MSTDRRPRTYLFVLPWGLEHPGGVNQVVINLAHEMIRSDSYRPIVLVGDWNAACPVWGESQGIKTINWRLREIPTMKTGLKEKFTFSLWARRFRSQFAQVCNAHDVAAINPHYPGLAALALDRIAHDINSTLPFIFSFHGTDISAIRGSSPPMIRQWQDALSRRQSAVACSNDLRRRIVDTIGDDIDPNVIYNGIDAEWFAGLADQLPTPTENTKKAILSVGRFQAQKGQDVLVRAFANLAADYLDTQLVLVGASDRELPVLKRMCSSLGIESRVEFYADIPHDKIASFFRDAAFFVLPSRQEAFGITLLEAGAMALPVIATRVGGIPEIISDGVTGRLVPPDDPEELEYSMRSFLKSPNTARQLGRHLHQLVTKRFSWHTAHNRYVSLVDTLARKQLAACRNERQGEKET